MANENMKHQSPEEIARAAQEAALEQIRAMMGSIQGMPDMPDMSDIQAQIMAKMQEAVPDLAEIQAQQAAMNTLGGVDAATVAEAAQRNMAQAAATMQIMQDGSIEKEANAASLDWLGEDDGWEIKHTETCRLTAEQRRLMAFAAPLLVYNDEDVDAVESEIPPETYRAQLQSWWDITDHDSTLGIVRWLLDDGHHADADAALALMRGDRPDAGDPEEKAGDVRLISEWMIENGCCTAETLPKTAIAWDLVRIANLGRWAFHAGYLSEEEMWQVMQVAADAARGHFASWEEYGRSFAFGRGVWHGDEDDCQTAWEIVTTLLEEETSPWRHIHWNA